MGNAIFYPENCKKPWKPLVVDKQQRKSILKQNFSIDKVPDNLDAIVIGSGLGGLTAAALLSRTGKKVLVLEQHHKAGGCCHVFKEKGFEFDVGIHYVGELGEDNSEMQVILDTICDGKIKFHALDDTYDEVVVKNEHIPIVKGYERCKSELVKHFPDEGDAINSFFSMCKAEDDSNYTFGLLKILLPQSVARWMVKTGAYKSFGGWFKYVENSCQSVVQSLTSNKKLQTVMVYCFGDFGVTPDKAPFCIQSMLWNYFLRKGGFYPVGGGSEFPFQIIPTIEKSGGKVLVRARVTDIILDGAVTGKQKAVGVRVKKTNGDMVEISAPIIISAAGYLNTFTRMISPDISSRLGMEVTPAMSSPGSTSIILFVGLDGSTEDLGLKSRNYWIYPTDNNLDGAGREGGEGAVTRFLSAPTIDDALAMDLPLIFVSFPSAKDPTWNQRYPGKSTCEVITFGRYEWFSEFNDDQVKKRRDDYQRIKEQIMKKMWHECLKYFPDLEDKVSVMECGTPITNNFYLGSTRGEIYGLDHDQERFSPQSIVKYRPNTPIDNLYLSGQDVFTCGITGAINGGVLCASAVLGRSLYLEMQWCRLKMTVTESVTSWWQGLKSSPWLGGTKKQD